MKNVEYFDIQPAIPIFEGLSNIRIFSNQIIYFFNRGKYDKEWDCVPILDTPEDTDIEIESYLRERKRDCMRARDWLIEKGFKIDMADPIPHSKLHYELSLNGKSKVGLLYNLRINLKNKMAIWFDDSQGEETGNVESNDPKMIVDIGHSRKNHIKIKEL